MATVTATVKSVEVVRGPLGVVAADTLNSNGGKTKLAIIYCVPSANMLAGDTLSLTTNTALQNNARNGKTVTVQSAMLGIPAFDATTNLSYCGKTQSGTTTFTFIPTGSDWSTNAALTAADRWERPFGVVVAYTEV